MKNPPLDPFWRWAAVFVGMFAAAYLVFAMIDWIPQAMSQEPPRPAWDRVPAFDGACFWINARALWFMSVLAFANTVAATACWRMARGYGASALVAAYVGIAGVIGIVLIVADARMASLGQLEIFPGRLYRFSEEDSLVVAGTALTLTWPLWLFFVRFASGHIDGSPRRPIESAGGA